VRRLIGHALGAALVVGVALTERLRRRRARPRVVWGPIPLISISYWSRALRTLGYDSQSVVTHHYAAYDRSVFDVYLTDLLAGRRLARLGSYYAMALMLRRADVFVQFFDGGFLGRTSLWRLEALALKLAGKKLVVCPYGGDIAVPGYLGPFEEAFVADYPATVERAPEVRRRVDWLCRHADLVIRNFQVGYLPRADVVWPQQVAVDTDLWAPGDAPRAGDDVVVVHAPNHRALKGTAYIEAAVERLREEGLGVRLDLLQNRPNEDVRRAVRGGDIVAEQFLGGYAMFAIEAMSAGKPVLSNLTWMSDELRAELGECPIVDATPETLTDQLRRLVADPELRQRLGRASRQYVLDHHSYAAVGERWAELFAALWSARSPSASDT
jgi:glycosyltransferase involved in cell wall biosynthesis